MAKLSGLNGRAYISDDGGSTYTLIGNLTNVNVDIQTDMQDSSDVETNYREFLPGKQAWTATADSFYEASDTGLDAVDTALTGRTLVDFKFVPKVGTGEDMWTGTGYVSAQSLNLANLDGPIATNITITGSGALTKGTQT